MKIIDTAIAQSHPSWQPLLKSALATLAPSYLEQLTADPTWLPGPANLLRAFSRPRDQLQYILFGESPYPRPQSAIGYAFWDGAVNELWSATGFSKAVNRATSLRNFIKMLLVADHKLTPDDLTQTAIQNIDKSSLITSIDELFTHLLDHGFLLLNASLVLSSRPVVQEAQAWQPFMQTVLQQIQQIKPDCQLILWGSIAKQIKQLLPAEHEWHCHQAPHPYNLSFIHDAAMQQLFGPLKLLAGPCKTVS